MSDLATALQQVLRQVRLETKHSDECINKGGSLGGFMGCYCDRLERVEAEQANRWAASIDAALMFHAPEASLDSIYDGVIRAAQQERGSA